MPLSHEMAVLCGSKGAHVAHSRHTGQEMTLAARKGFHARFERQARAEAMARGDCLSDAEVARRAEHLKSAHMRDLAIKKASKHGAFRQRTSAA